MAAIVETPSEPPQLKPLDSHPIVPAEVEEAQTQLKLISKDLHLLLATYLGLSFSVFLSFLPKSTLSLLPNFQSRNEYLASRLCEAEEQLFELKSRRQEDSKANARVVEIFASHRNAWNQEERRLLRQIDDSNDEISRLHDDIERLRARVAELERNENNLLAELEELKKEVVERDELLNFMSRKTTMKDMGMGGGENGSFVGGNGEYYGGIGEVRVADMDVKECIGERERKGDFSMHFGQNNVNVNGYDPDMLPSASKFWAEQAHLWQDTQYEPIEPVYHQKQFVTRRESPWKVNGDAAGVASKLKQLEQDLLNLERIGKNELSGNLRKHAKRYQGLAGKIDDLCERMLTNDPCESDFRAQRQQEFLVEAFQLQQRASETGQKLMALHTEISSSHMVDELGAQTKLTTRRSLDSIRNNFKEIQRNLETWLARIIGDLKGILASDGASRAGEYCVSRYRYF